MSNELLKKIKKIQSRNHQKNYKKLGHMGGSVG